MPLTKTALHRITVIHGVARVDEHSVAACPRQKQAVDLERCLSCPYLMAFDSAGQRDKHLLCVTQEEESVAAEPGSVASFMSRDVVCVRADVSIESLAAVFLQKNVGGLPVVDEERRLVGFVSKTDLVRALAHGRFHEDPDTFDIDASYPPARDVHDVMTAPVTLVLKERDAIGDAAARLTAERMHRAPVVADDGRVVGVITTFDLLRAMAAKSRTELEDA